jgi:hypothetical protein
MIHILHPELKELIDNLQLQIARVRELHKQVARFDTSKQGYTCQECYASYPYYEYEYPCPTIKALDGEQ